VFKFKRLLFESQTFQLLFLCGLAKRYVIIGPPGSQSHDISLRMIEQLNRGSEFQCVNVGDQLLFEMNKRLEAGKKAAEAFKTHSYVEDEIVIELLQGIINQYEQQQTNYIIEGFPRTQRQALALLKMGIIPDKMILLERRDGEVIEYL